MSTFSDRAKAIRKSTGLTQEAFAQSIGLTWSAYVNFEYDKLKRDSAKEPTIKAICNRYHISEKWLRNGEGEMYASHDADKALFEWAGETLASGDSFKIALFNLMRNLEPEYWDMLKALAARLAQENEKGGQS